jgi:hypothetical protein
MGARIDRPHHTDIEKEQRVDLPEFMHAINLCRLRVSGLGVNVRHDEAM